jgi:hypothetical protein
VTGLSFLRVLSDLDSQTPVDILTSASQTLDLTDWLVAYNLGTPGVIFPIFIFATASYKLGLESTAKIEFRTSVVASDDSVILGQVFYDGSDLSVSATLPIERGNPFAYVNAPLGYGFMPDSAANGLLEGLNVTNEVIEARLDLSGTTWPSLSDRLAEDFSAPSMAGRLAKSVRVVRSNVHTLTGPATSINVSGSFSEVTRQSSPLLTIDGAGDETQPGAITGPHDAERNVVFIVNDDTKERPIDNDIDRIPVYGRLLYSEALLTGTYTCTVGDPNVVGVGTFFTVEAQPGDLILGADGLYYEIASITDNLNLVLTTNFGGSTGPVSNGIQRRFTLEFKKVDVNTEVTAALPAGDIQFFVGAFYGLDTPVFDSAMVMHQGGEPVRIGIATDATSGRVLIDGDTDPDPTPLIGAIQTIKDSGFEVSQNTYDINFDGAAPGGSPGVVDITQRGPTGDTGPAGVGAPGPAGPQGPTGIGFNGGANHAATNTTNHMWIKRTAFDNNVGFNVSYFHTVNGNSYNLDEVLWATAGIWYIYDYGGGNRPQGENWRLINVTRDTLQQVTLTAATETAGALAVNIGIALNLAGRT